MRVVLATLAPEHGGVGRHMLDLGAGIRDRGHDVTFALRPSAKDLPDHVAAAGFTAVPLIDSLRRVSDVWHLHLHNTLDTRALPALIVRRAFGSGSIVLTEHLPRTPRTDQSLDFGPTPVPGWRKPGAKHAKRLLKRAQFATAHRTICVSEASRRFLIERYGVSDGRIGVVYNGFDAAADPQPPAGGDRLRITVIGALHWRKGVDVLLSAASLARHTWSITVVGDGPSRTELERQAADLPTGTVTFSGWTDDVVPHLRDTDVVAVPSRSESFSYATLEAMAHGRPVVASRVDGPDELLRDGVDGILVPPEDAAALAAALDSLAADSARRERMGHEGRQRAVLRFGIDQMVDETLRTYEEVS